MSLRSMSRMKDFSSCCRDTLVANLILYALGTILFRTPPPRVVLNPMFKPVPNHTILPLYLFVDDVVEYFVLLWLLV